MKYAAPQDPTHSSLETLSVIVPEAFIPLFEAAFTGACEAVAFFEEDDKGEFWRIEAVHLKGKKEEELQSKFLIAQSLSGLNPELIRQPLAEKGWLARNMAAFPEQNIDNRFIIRGTHLQDAPPRQSLRNPIVITLDAGMAFGSGEHATTRACLQALSLIAAKNAPQSRGRRILDLGTGSGILALAAAKLFHLPVTATDIDAISIEVAKHNAKINRQQQALRLFVADGWKSRRLKGQKFDLVFANILARPLCTMAHQLSQHLAEGGYVILSGLLQKQVRMILAAHRRNGLVLVARLNYDNWSALVLKKPI